MDQSPQGFASEDEEATYCLSLLRDGDRHQKIVARERLSQIFERRGMLDEAAQCLESNIREGVRDPRVYQRLAGVYRRQGRHELADEVLVEARRLAERMQRPQPPGARRPGPAGPPRPGRPAPAPPPPGQPQAPTPAAQYQAPSTPPPPPTSGATGLGELELDPVGARPGPAPLTKPNDAAAPARQPGWVLPAIVVLLLVLPFSPYGIALMWVRGSYSKAAKTRVTAIWAALMILLTAGAALTVQNQVAGLVAASLASGGLPAPGVAPTPIVFPSAGAPAVKPTLPTGLAPSPPTISVSPGALPTRSADTPIAPAAAAEAKPTASPQPEPDEASDDDDAPGPEMVKVKDTDGSGANMRDKPGQTGTVMKTIPEGTTLEVIGEDRQMDGKTWKNVKDESGAQGWIAAELLEPA